MPDHPRYTRYTRKQVLNGIRCFLEKDFGLTAEFTASTPLHDYHDSHLKGGSCDADSVCPLEVLTDLSEYFGFSWGESHWTIWLKIRGSEKLRSGNLTRSQQRRLEKAEWNAWLRDVSPTLTFGRLADTIIRRGPAPSFAPITVFGSRCEPAGVFTGLQSLPELKGKRVAPSTRLLDALGPFDMRDYFARVGWTTGVTPPPCYQYRLFGAGRADQNTATLAALIVTLASLTELGSALGGIGFWGFVLRVVIWLVAAMTVHTALINRLGNPLPEDMRTFADLARRIASKREAAT